METPSLYIPMDRRQALARATALPEQARGAALFADISGFTPLTEALAREFGPQRGAEELTRQLNGVYDAVIAEVDRFGGGVIGFSGDAVTCWFDGDVRRATASALAMQQAMSSVAAVATPSGRTFALAMKAAVAAGPVRRFVVGDPGIQLLDVLAGATLDRLAAAEHLADSGDVVLDRVAVEELGAAARVVAWREDGTGQRFAVVAGLAEPVEPEPWPSLDGTALAESETRRWVLPAVYERLQAGGGEFLTELRPAVALFLRFTGIRFEDDPAASAKLDAYVRWVQAVVSRYEGTLLQLTIGDKGSYLYAAFGAPLAHEDDTARAAAAALELRAPPGTLSFVGDPQIGLSRGRMRTGSYGGSTCRTYGVLGDEVNLAARLMQNARPGQILVSRGAQQAIASRFAWVSLSPLSVKGKSEPVALFELMAPAER